MRYQVTIRCHPFIVRRFEFSLSIIGALLGGIYWYLEDYRM
jgi:hypothetical protein